MKTAILTTLLLVLAACSTLSPAPNEDAATGIAPDVLLSHIRILSSDRFEGRAPGTAGEKLTVDYLINQFRLLGLKPGNPDGTYVQDVPLVGLSGKSHAAITVKGKPLPLKVPEDYVLNSRRFKADVSVKNSDLVFVGYGVVAPEYGWDDYKGMNVKGKTLVMLVNDPPVKDRKGELDDDYFHGKAMTYYGRWTYKFEIGSEKGAAGVLIVHETGPAGYPWQVVSSSWAQEEFDIDAPGGNSERVPVEGWITEPKARQLFAMSGQSFDELKKAAASKDFKPVKLKAKGTFTVHNAVRHVKSKNVVARLPGSDPELSSQYVIHTAHWDHLGRDSKKKGDAIYNGAVDNASGTAGLLELARAYTKLSKPPRRSVLFVAVTSEEKGLLGSKWYANHPLYPLEKTVAEFNLDGVNPWGRTSDLVVVGKGQSELEDTLESALSRQGREMVGDPEPEKGFYYRSDQFEFAKVGVPALFINPGTKYVGQAAGYGRQKRDDYTAHDYHQVSDEIKPDWDLSGGAQDLDAVFATSHAVAEKSSYPDWKRGSEFKARREAMLK